MSTPSINPPTSPSSRWLSNDDANAATASRRSGELRQAAQTESVNHLAALSDEVRTQSDSYPPAYYPVDENIFYSAPSQPLDGTTAAVDQDVADDDEEGRTGEEAATEELVAPPDFKPFFTVIEDPETGEHHHPSVHYVFSDDEGDILTAAGLDSLDRHDKTSQPPDEVEERCIIVDMAADGKSIVSASSMSPDWQALKTTVTQAPSWGDDANNPDRGLMLKISGQEARASHSSTKAKPKQHTRDVEQLIKVFNDRLDKLDEVIGKKETAADNGTTIERFQ